ncbi:MAG TPA: replicative DNA helicase [Nevskiaceae bacterium]|nr:replicative DNA helicase [Nevskiaceae bacterium]
MSTPKVPPYSIEAEQSVLGGLLLHNSAWNDLADRLVEADFYRADHQLIYRSISALVGANRPCDFVTLSEYLREHGQLEEAGGLAYLGQLANDTPSVSNIQAYAEIVRERSVLRSLIAVGNDIAELSFRPEGRSAQELIDLAEQRVFAIRERGQRASRSYFDMPQVMTAVYDKVSALRANPLGSAGLSTGFAEFDNKTSGLGAGDLMILAARPSMGKTTLAMNIAEHVAFDRKEAVAVFSMEMSAEQLGYRVISSRCGIPMQKLRSGQLDDVEMDQLAWSVGKLREAPLFIDETGALSPNDLRAKARRLAQRENIRLIVVDYIQLMQVPGTRENRTNEISEISRSLKALAKELGIPVIALSQLNRGVEQRDNKRPRMSDLRESGGIEQDADLVVFIYRDWVYNKDADERQAEVIIAKQRNGPLGTVNVRFLGEFTRFENPTPSYEGFAP